MEAFVARQPLYNRSEKLVGYELFYRDGMTNAYPAGVTPLESTAKLINNTHLTLGISQLTHNHIALINFSEEALLQRLPLLLNPKEVIVEILESVPPSDAVYDAVKELHSKGYLIALDDFVYSREWLRFVKLASILKIDVQKSPLSTMKSFILNMKKNLPKVRLLAEKVETLEEYEEAMELGFNFFQGYYFGKPKIQKLNTIAPQIHNVLNIYQVLLSDAPSVDEVVTLVSQDTALLYKLLRYINSGIFGQSSPIKSVRNAINYIGLERMKKFTALLLTCSAGEDKPQGLVVSSITRAKMSELVAERTTANNEQSFFVGLLSQMDAILDVPLAMVLKKINVAKDIQLALLGEKSELSKETLLLRNILKLAECQEAGGYYETKRAADLVGVNYETVPVCYKKAVTWVDDFLSAGELFEGMDKVQSIKYDLDSRGSVAA